ncbi:MAG TPA: hypothetical protein VHC63_15835 [Acidimicrobiales bacterium]|nr:hypothetical protein [Acidimicrobiales bacterium]
MGKASQAKKVNRAAATGGGRTAGKKTPVGWYSALFVVVVLGVLGVFMASKNLDDTKASASTVPPVVNKDHWHTAYGFNLCGKWAAPLKDGPQGDQTGIHTHEDGLVHIHPFVASVAGKNATFGKLFDDTGVTVTATSVNLKRAGEKFKNGDKCGKKPGELTTYVFKNLKDTKGTKFSGNPSDIRLKDGMLITVSFNPKGFKVTQPPSAATLPNPADLQQTTNPTDTVPQDTSTSAP